MRRLGGFERLQLGPGTFVHEPLHAVDPLERAVVAEHDDPVAGDTEVRLDGVAAGGGGGTEALGGVFGVLAGAGVGCGGVFDSAAVGDSLGFGF